MKRLRAKIDSWLDRLDEQWKALPREKQFKYTLLFFLVYATLTTAVVLHTWYDAGKTDNKVIIEHIENPVMKNSESGTQLQDSLSTILKNKIYERK